MICLLPSAAMFITVMFGGKQSPPSLNIGAIFRGYSFYRRDLGRRDTDWKGDGR